MASEKAHHATHRRYFQIAGITVQVEADLPITDTTFHPKFNQFAASGPGDDNIHIHHRFYLPDPVYTAPANEIYRKLPWRILKREDLWIYQGIANTADGQNIYQIALINADHTRAEIHHANEYAFRNGGNHSLTLFPTDQILLARVLADRDGSYFHSAGIILDHKGFLFAGHSEAGKSTLVKNLSGSAEILCDDRIIVRKSREGFRVFGTWSHGDVQTISNRSAELSAIMFLEQAEDCRLVPLTERKEIVRRLLSLLIKPLITGDWWEKMLKLVEEISQNVPCYRLRFRKDDDLTDYLKSTA
ncbi:MAG: hypothetical protein AB1427_02195 [Thermodesulfobacteriota bacterium]